MIISDILLPPFFCHGSCKGYPRVDGDFTFHSAGEVSGSSERRPECAEAHEERERERRGSVQNVLSLLPHSTLGPERKINDTQREGAREESGMKNSKFF